MPFKIATPCSQDWNKMTPVEGGRFCDHCSKKVHDLTAGAEPPARGGFCGRIVTEKSIRQSFKRFIWEQRPLQFFLLMLTFLLARNTQAQEQKPQVADTDSTHNINGIPSKKITVKGTLIDKSTKEIIPFGNILITNKEHQVLGTAITDMEGKYAITLNEIKEKYINIKAVYAGYTSREIVKIPLTSLKKEINIKLDPSPGEVILVGLIDYVQPLTDPFGSQRIITRDQWNQMPK